MSLYERYERCRKSPFKNVNEDTHTQWDWEYNKETDTLTFRFDETGNSFPRWMNNFKFMAVPYKGMDIKFRVHRGFLAMYRSVRYEVHKIIVNHSGVKHIEVLGFSQGAAIATLCHEDIQYNFGRHSALSLHTFTYGSPRVVSLGAPKDRWHHLFRVVNGKDIVTKVPFWFFLYKHVGVKIQIGNVGGWWKLFSIKDHVPSNYKESLKQLD